MAGMTLDMYTTGANAGELVRPLAYTTDDDNATRVEVYLQLATPFGKYVFNTDEGLDYDRILDPNTSDEERGALVRDVVLAHPRVESVVAGPIVTVDNEAANGPRVTIKVTFRTITGTSIEIGT
jgi:hypothetical protein